MTRLQRNVAPTGQASGKRPRLIATDFDLTIFDHEEPDATRLLIPWFEACHRSGVLVGLASGRTITSLREGLDGVGVRWQQPFPAFVICNEGSIVTPGGESWPGCEGWNNRRCDAVGQVIERFEPVMEDVIRCTLSRGCVLMHPLVSSEAGLSVVYQTPVMAERARRMLVVRLKRETAVEVSRNHHIVSLGPVAMSKGDAVARLCDAMHIPADEVLAIGDNLNDLGMFDARHGFQVAAVANAVEMVVKRVRRRNGFVADARAARGVCQIFKHYFHKTDP